MPHSNGQIRDIRDLMILRQERIRVRNFSIPRSARVNQLHLAAKRDSRRHSTASFSDNVAVAETSY